ncbi:unnamed protein product, partial [Ixodes pacificus]
MHGWNRTLNAAVGGTGNQSFVYKRQRFTLCLLSQVPANVVRVKALLRNGQPIFEERCTEWDSVRARVLVLLNFEPLRSG